MSSGRSETTAFSSARREETLLAVQVPCAGGKAEHGQHTSGGEQVAELTLLGGPQSDLLVDVSDQTRAGPPLKLADLALIEAGERSEPAHHEGDLR